MDLPAGRVVKPGDTIALTVSRGPELIALPNVIGERVAEARKTLEELGMRVVVRAEEQNGNVDEALARVIAMEPAAGRQVPPGTEVILGSRVPDGG
jgi:serine/threonine-protein kinase